MTTPDTPAPTHEGARSWRAGWAVDLPGTLAPLRRGGGDPSSTVPAPGQLVLAANTPAGPGTLHVGVSRDGRTVEARAWGSPGAVRWLLDGVPELLGSLDRPEDLRPVHAVLERAHARHSPGLRVLRTRRVWDALLPAVVEQKVTGQEAFAGYRALVRATGTPAPGPAGVRGLLVPPDAATVARVPSWVFLRCGIDAGRSDTLVRAARVGARWEQLVAATASMGRAELDRAHALLRTVPGIGPWTAAEVAHRALGDPDAVSWRDYHVAAHVTRALTGTAGDDVDLARVLAPYAGQRYRVQMLLGASRETRPERHGPRLAPRTHLPVAGRGHTP